MAENGTTHNGQVRIGPHKIMGELPHKIQQVRHGFTADLHGRMAGIEQNAVFIIIHIGGILQKPVFAQQRNRDQAMVTPGRLGNRTDKAFVLPAQRAFRITAALLQTGRRNGFRVFFRLAQVNGNDDFAVGGHTRPFFILGYPVHPDIVGTTAQIIIIIGGLFRIGFVQFTELLHHFRRPGHQAVHDFGVEQVAVYRRIIFPQPLFAGPIQHGLQDFSRIFQPFLRRLFRFIIGDMQQGNQPVGCIHPVFFSEQPPLHAVLYQSCDFTVHIHVKVPLMHVFPRFPQQFYRYGRRVQPPVPWKADTPGCPAQ